VRMVWIIVALLALVLAGCAVNTHRYVSRVEDRFPPIGKFVEVRGVKAHYIDEGQGRPVVLIHGATANLRDMKHSLVGPLTQKYRVIAVDRPGHGYSGRPSEAYYDPELQAEFILEVLRILKVEDPIIVGHSWGGAVAAAFAVNHQDEIAGVVTLAGATHPWHGGTAWYNTVSTTPVLGPVARNTLIPIMGPPRLEEGLASNFAPNEPPEGYLDQVGIELLFRPSQFKANAADSAYLNDELAEQAKRYDTIRVPMIVLTGDSDTTVGPRIHSVPLSEQAQDAELVMLEGVGHMPHYAARDEVLAAIDRLAAKVWGVPTN